MYILSRFQMLVVVVLNTVSDIQVQSDPPDFSITSTTPADATDCGVNDGNILVSLSADIFPISYVITNSDDGTGTGPVAVANAITGTSFDFDITGLRQGTFDLEVTSAGGCIQTATGILVNQPQPVELTTEPFVELCGASAPLTATSTTVGTRFNWTGPNGFAATGGTVNAPESGTYTVTATGGCPTSADVVVDLTIQPTVQINEVGDVCDGKITLEAEVTNPQAGATYTFNWDNGSNSNSITVDASGTYSVTARNTANLTCEGVASTNVTVPVPLEATVSSSPACDDGSPINLSVNVTAGSPTTFTWTLNGGIVGNGQSISVIDEGDYLVNISDGTCNIERGISIRRQAIPEGELPDTEFYCSTSSDNPVLFAGSGFDIYEWILDGAPFTGAGQTLEVNAPGVYVVIMTTSIGCVRQDTVTILESCDPQVFVPNVFSPSSDPPNNSFSAFPNDFVSDFEVYIYTRWGELIYQSNTIEFKWDGKLNGQLVPPGTYPYIIRFSSRVEPERGIFEQRGSVRVIR